MTQIFPEYLSHCSTNGPATTTPTNRAIEMTFYECDLDQKGYLSKEDLKVAFITLLGYKPSKVEVDRIIELYCQRTGIDTFENIPGLDLKQFISMMSHKIASKNKDEEIREIFLTFDTHCNGFLVVDDFKRALSIVAPRLHPHRIESAFREIDRDSDGRVTYRDFEFMLKYHSS